MSKILPVVINMPEELAIETRVEAAKRNISRSELLRQMIIWHMKAIKNDYNFIKETGYEFPPQT